MLNTLDLIFIVVYFLIVLYIGFSSGKKESKEEYLIGGRGLNTLSATLTISASKMGGGLLLTYTALVFLFGLSAFWFFIGMVAGYIGFYFFAIRLKTLADLKKYYTLPDFYFDQYGKTTGRLSAVIVLITTMGWVIVNFIGGAKILASFSNISFETSTITVGLIILVYLLAGGFKAVVKTDAIQMIGVSFLFILMIYLMISVPMNIKSADLDILSLPTLHIFAFFIIGLLHPMASAELWQRVYAVENHKVLKRSLISSCLVYFTIGIFLLVIGLAIRSNFSDIDPDNSLITGLSRMLPPGLRGLAVIVFCSAIMSSADTYLFTTNSTLTQDLISRSDQMSLRNTRMYLIIIAIISIVFAIILKGVIDTTSVFVSLMMSLGLITYMVWFIPAISKLSVNLAMVLSFCGVLIYVLYQGIDPFIIVISLGLSLCGITLGYAYKKLWLNV